MSDLKHTIVVVDDDAEMNLAIRRLLNAAGFSSVTFHSAEACLEAAVIPGASCLVLDTNLPGLSGFELRHRLQQKGLNAPVIFITGFDNPTSRVRAEEADAAAYFAKPFRGKALLEAVIKAAG